MKRTTAACLALVCSLGCSGESLTQGLEEPIQIQGAQFRRGTLPGSLPADEPEAPRPTSLASQGRTVEQGSSGISIVGRTTPDAESIAVLLHGGGGSGYWVLPVGTPEPQFNDEPTFGFSVAFGRELAGMQRLRVAAIDARGESGTQSELEICVAPRVPDNLNACVPTIAPPELVVSLSWDRAADLDLVVVAPSGKQVSPKDPSTVNLDEAGDPVPGETVGVFDLDSNAGCRGDGRRLENLVFQERPEPGRYLIYANLFDACGEDSVRFSSVLYEKTRADADDTYTVNRSLETYGVLTRAQANAGTKLGTFVTQFQVR
ncbi:MAG TPA: hypothetical protein VI197_14560 [Polyangiaceae bacterium]